jgi:hypothetical protein
MDCESPDFRFDVRYALAYGVFGSFGRYHNLFRNHHFRYWYPLIQNDSASPLQGGSPQDRGPKCGQVLREWVGRRRVLRKASLCLTRLFAFGVALSQVKGWRWRRRAESTSRPATSFPQYLRFDGKAIRQCENQGYGNAGTRTARDIRLRNSR